MKHKSRLKALVFYYTLVHIGVFTLVFKNLKPP